MAGAQNGTLTFEYPNKVKFFLSVYLDDTTLHPVTFSITGKADANSPNNWVATQLCGLVDVCIAAAPTVSSLIVNKNDYPVYPLLIAQFLAAIVTRPEPGLTLYPGNKLTITQVT